MLNGLLARKMCVCRIFSTDKHLHVSVISAFSTIWYGSEKECDTILKERVTHKGKKYEGDFKRKKRGRMD